ncbi:MAG: hypothetical protein AAF572_22520 [Cyanobacteria bacterium P01_B01_bin.77]
MESILLAQKEIEVASQVYGTPLYLYNLNKITYQFANLLEHLPSNFIVHYALKANSSLAICSKLAQLGASVDVSSLGELHTALKVGFLPENIVFTGPGKTKQELSVALNAKCGLVALESFNQAQILDDLAFQAGIKQDVIIRINPIYRTTQSCESLQQCSIGSDKAISSDTAIQIITQSASKFGVDEEVAAETIDKINNLKHLTLKGIHIYTESNVLAYQDLLQSWKNTVSIADRLRDQGYPISLIDFGGGIGIPYSSTKSSFDIVRFGQEIQKLLETSRYKYRCLVEIGRYLVGEAGCYITEIIDIKQSRGQLFLILDGGINHLLRPSSSMKEATKYLEVLSKKSDKTKPATLVGKLMTSLDVLVENVQVPENIEIGDRIVIYNCGAYGFNHSLTNFLLHNYPAEAAYQDDQLCLIRERGKVEDFFVNQKLPFNKALEPIK